MSEWKMECPDDDTVELKVRVSSHLLRTESIATLEKIVGYELYKVLLNARRDLFIKPRSNDGQ